MKLEIFQNDEFVDLWKAMVAMETDRDGYLRYIS